MISPVIAETSYSVATVCTESSLNIVVTLAVAVTVAVSVAGITHSADVVNLVADADASETSAEFSLTFHSAQSSPVLPQPLSLYLVIKPLNSPHSPNFMKC